MLLTCLIFPNFLSSFSISSSFIKVSSKDPFKRAMSFREAKECSDMSNLFTIDSLNLTQEVDGDIEGYKLFIIFEKVGNEIPQ